MNKATIAAIATPLGEGGISIVRVSGNDAIDISQKISSLNLKELPARRMSLGFVVFNEARLDRVLWVVMPGPNSFTGEDVVEIHCHGGLMVTELILEAVINSGARLAEPGEFSKRAFLNGKLDLAQAESIVDVIRAKTATSLRVAFRGLEGQLSDTIEENRDDLLSTLSTIEASIDYPEDVEEPNRGELRIRLESMIRELDDLIGSYQKGKSLREGYLVVIVGRPNVGKSSLLNQLAKEEKAIVTDVPGTTRDVVEVEINIGGVPVVFADTAGLRDTDDKVESIGVGKSKAYVNKADLILWVLDSSEALTSEDRQIAKILEDKAVIVVLNKQDMPSQIQVEEISSLIPSIQILPLSLTEKTGLDAFMLELEKQVGFGGVEVVEEVLITRVRHKKALEKAKDALKNAISFLSISPLDLIAIDLRMAYSALGEITGHTVKEDVIDRIFQEFCLGK
ncbi:MAG: tRNA uridine-5-carboxymethylaminomethyl(34) synthesis GTPase MnmE [Firmicutes bacterium]|nr:tRNA uridine-5-carboxymethylaminomethyl(34) synthesis GTPase MnmE [Bacillota bacterium]MDD4264341.1 tRNA uridine-5-carboxymethylaminomethyl(34) synthesis GTPase MnmE [Bacillota bacterium]